MNINNIEVTETHDPDRPFKAWYKIYADTPLGPRVGEGTIVYGLTRELAYDTCVKMVEENEKRMAAYYEQLHLVKENGRRMAAYYDEQQRIADEEAGYAAALEYDRWQRKINAMMAGMKI